ncbi:MAG: hypothetical protein WA708_10625 [Acidobacteriaceae bacterium]
MAMKSLIVVWNKSNAKSFEDQIPLLFNGMRNLRLGSKNAFDVLFLEGLNLLSRGYKERLSGLGYKLHDLATCYRKFESKYSKLAQFGDYERKCFLRWLVIKDFCGNSPFVHYDADVVFNATPEELDSAFAGLTFVLQGCPAYTRVSDPTWLEIYETELDSFNRNIKAYSENAWNQRDSYITRFKELNSNIWDRRLLSSDQDLLQFLTLSGRLAQADAAVISARNNYALFQNPITIRRDLQLSRPFKYERRDGIDYINSVKVAFWHMQGDFSDYLGYATFRNQLGNHHRVPWIRARQNSPSSVDYSVYRTLRRLVPLYSRNRLLHRYFGGEADLNILLNSRTFWEDGTFA